MTTFEIDYKLKLERLELLEGLLQNVFATGKTECQDCIDADPEYIIIAYPDVPATKLGYKSMEELWTLMRETPREKQHKRSAEASAEVSKKKKQ